MFTWLLSPHSNFICFIWSLKCYILAQLKTLFSIHTCFLLAFEFLPTLNKLEISNTEKSGNWCRLNPLMVDYIVMFFQVMDLKDRALPFSSPVPAQRKTPPMSHKQVNPAPHSTSLAEVSVSSLDAAENGINQEGEGMILNLLSPYPSILLKKKHILWLICLSVHLNKVSFWVFCQLMDTQSI